MVRIQKLLASWGIASRRSIEKFIQEGRIAVDGDVINEQGFIIDENNIPKITLDGKLLKAPSDKNYTVLAFHKPKLVITSLKDEHGRRSIADFLPKDKRLYPIGRLDYDSTGLLLVTDYGELTNRLLHPSFKVAKEYIVRISGEPLGEADLKSFAKGIELDDGMTAPAIIKALSADKCYSVIIKEGRKRQVRRMFEFFGRKVIRLHRITFGPIRLGNLEAGKLRQLTKEEYSALLSATGLSSEG